jgi:hypothetical protein
MDFLAFVAFVVLVLRHDFREDVVLALEPEELVREERVGTEVVVLVFEAVDLERVDFDVGLDRVVPLKTWRDDGSELREVEDAALVVVEAGGGILSLNREAFSCK